MKSEPKKFVLRPFETIWALSLVNKKNEPSNFDKIPPRDPAVGISITFKPKYQQNDDRCSRKKKHKIHQLTDPRWEIRDFWISDYFWDIKQVNNMFPELFLSFYYKSKPKTSLT